MSGTIALIELVVGDGVYDFGRRVLIEVPIPFGWSTGRGDRWRPGRLADVSNTNNP